MAFKGNQYILSLVGFLLVLFVGLSAVPVQAQKDPIVFGFAQDFTRVYTFACQELNQGELDYLELINIRGGIDGHKFEPKVTDTGNEPQRGIEAYERFKKQGAVLFDFCSTPVTNAIIPRALDDEIVVLTIGYGRSDAVDGTTFPYVFPIIGNYWTQAARIIDYIDQQKGGIDGDRIAFIYLESAFGREPIPLLKDLSNRLGYELETFPVPPPGTEQSSAWSKIRRYRPDHIIQWFAGPSTGVSLREAIRNGFQPGQVHSVSWIEQKDLAQVRAGLAGVQRTEAVTSGRSPELVQAILNEVYAADRGNGPIENVGTTYYNYGVGAMAVAVEAARIAVE